MRAEPALTGVSGMRSDIQGLRALAVLLVVIYHTGIAVPGGYIGVDVFFVISGYVITGSLVRRWGRGERFSLLQFFGRRVRRLLPALAAMTVVCLPLMSVFTTFDGRTQGFETARAASTFMANVQLMLFRPNGYFVASEQTNPFLHTWSLSLEEQIYFLYPFLAVLLMFSARRAGPVAKRVVLVAGFSILGLVSLWLSLIGTLSIDAFPVNHFLDLSENADFGRQLAFYSSVTRLWEFLAGAVLAVVPVVSARVLAGGLASVGLGLVIGTALWIDSASAFPGWIALFPVGGTCLLILSRGGWMHGILSSRPVGWIGDRSYSWYLWHWPAITFGIAVFPGSRAIAAGAAIGSLLLAEGSFRLIESPIRNAQFFAANGLRTLVLGVVCVAVPYALATHGQIEPTPELATHEDVEFGCVTAEFTVLLGDEACFWPVEDPRGDAVLIGDSQAGHLSGAFISAAHEQSLNARIVTRTGAFFQNTPDRDELARLIIEDLRPRVVVLGQLTISWEPDYWAPQMRGYVQRFSDAGIGVVVPHRIRKGGEPLECPPIRFGVLDNTCELSIEDSSQSAGEIKTIIEFERTVLEDVERLKLVDPNIVLCPLEPCRSLQDGKWIWRDGGHISREGARRLRVPLTEAIGALLVEIPGGGPS